VIKVLKAVLRFALVAHIVGEAVLAWWLMASAYRLAIGDTHDDALFGVIVAPLLIALLGYRINALLERLRHETGPSQSPPTAV